MKVIFMVLCFLSCISIVNSKQSNPETIEEIYELFKTKYDKAENKTYVKKTTKRKLESEFSKVLSVEETMITFTPTNNDIAKLESLYFPNVRSAKQDLNDYSTLSEPFQTAENISMYYYSRNPPDGYSVEIPNPAIYKIKIRINPCEGRTTSDDCCDATNEGACGDNTFLEAGVDMTVAWFTNGYIFHCSDVFEKAEICGTFIEIHRPTDPRVIEFVQIHKLYRSGYSTEYISTKKLCAGRYELWYVLRSRNGRALQYVKPFYCYEPSCSSEQINNAKFR